jgi:hypothetical protein
MPTTGSHGSTNQALFVSTVITSKCDGSVFLETSLPVLHVLLCIEFCIVAKPDINSTHQHSFPGQEDIL